MKKVPLRQKLSYHFDNLMSKGTAALVGLLFLLTLIVVLIVACISAFFAPDSVGTIGNSLWQSLMRVLDAGNVAGDFEAGNPIFLILMLLATVCGLFVTSILIGIINAAFESKLSQLRKGNSRVIESGHVLILGYDAHLFSILSELIVANENGKNPKIVILSEQDKEAMEEEISSHIPDSKNTKIICRTGDTTSFSDLKNVSIESCSSIIVLAANDFSVVKSVLAATTLLDQLKISSKVHITAVITDEESLEAAKIAGGARLEVLYFEKTIARIFAQTCRQSGLSLIYQELFDFEGDEIYMEKAPTLVGQSFEQVPLFYRSASVLGLFRNGRALLNPPTHTIVEAQDSIILIAADDGVAKPEASAGSFDESQIHSGGVASSPAESMLILGYNPLAPNIIKEMALYSEPSLKITIASPYEDMAAELEAEEVPPVTTVTDNIYSRTVLEPLLATAYDYIIVLSDISAADDPDAHTLMLLLQLRDSLKGSAHAPTIVSEMQDSTNQRLAQCTNVNDFVIGSNLVSLMMTQVSQNRILNAIFEELLTDEGCEIYMKPAAAFVKLDVPVNFYTVTHSATCTNQLALGYKKQKPDGTWDLVLNPDKSKPVIFSKNDRIIALAEDYFP